MAHMLTEPPPEGGTINVPRTLGSGYFLARQEDGQWLTRCRWCDRVTMLPVPVTAALILVLIDHETNHRFVTGEYDAEAWDGRLQRASGRSRHLLTNAERKRQWRQQQRASVE